MMTALRTACLVVLSSLALAACQTAPWSGEEAKSSLDRLTTQAPPQDVKAATRGFTELNLSLNRRIAPPDQNVVFSPTSISTALAMASAGAANETLDAFRDTLRITTPQADFHAAVNSLDLALTSRGQHAQGTDGTPFALHVVNQTFAQQGFHLEQSYLDLLAQQYGAGLKLLDFKDQPDPARKTINEWVSYETEALIPELLKEGTVTSDTRVVLVNAVFFDAAWASAFEPSATHDAAFTLNDGAQVQTPTMNGDVDGRFATVDGVDVVSLPYDGDEVSMVLLVPPAGSLGALEQQLTADGLDAYVSALQPTAMQVALPKFDVEFDKSLAESLSAEGLAPAFDARADFSGMTGDRSLVIDDVIHHAVIQVEEKGTRAAAATAVTFRETAAPVSVPVKVDRPFVFFVRDDATGAVLFMGHVVDPR